MRSLDEFAGIEKEKTAFEELDEMVKVAADTKETEDRDERKSPTDDLGAGAALMGAGAFVAVKSKNNLLGKKRVYHGTTSENARSIKKIGLDPKFGGDKKKGSFHTYADANGEAAETLRKRSEGYVFVTPKKNIAKNFAYQRHNPEFSNRVIKSQNPLDMLKFEAAAAGHDIKSKGAGRVNINLDYNKWKRMVPDEDSFIITDKSFAAKGAEKISPEEIKGASTIKKKLKHTMKELPSYIKENPARFAAGVAGVGLGTAGTMYGAHLIRKSIKKRKDKAEKEKTAFEELDEMVKAAGYLKDINCEQCGYKGAPDPDGTCPTCGAIGGHKPHGLQKKYEPTLEDVENSKNTADDDFREEQERIHSMMLGG